MPKKNVKSCKNKLGKCGVIETPRQEAVIGGNLLELHFWCCDDGDDDDHHHDDHDDHDHDHDHDNDHDDYDDDDEVRETMMSSI